MEQLEISRGNANMNLRALMDWGIVRKEFVKATVKNILLLKKTFGFYSSRLQKKEEREIEPVISFLEELKNIEDKDSDEAKSSLN
jgi:DNA-binding transcriptional regulator GbsR (MarR family)